MKRDIKILYILLILFLIIPFFNLFFEFRGIIMGILGTFWISYLIVILISHFELRQSNKSLKFIILKSIGLIGLISVVDIGNFFIKVIFSPFMPHIFRMAEFAGLQWVMAIGLFIVLSILNSIAIYIHYKNK